MGDYKDLFLVSSFAAFFIIYIFYCSASFERYIFSKHHGLVTYAAISLYFIFIPTILTVFSVGTVTLLFKAFWGAVPIPWIIPILCFICYIIMLISPSSLVSKYKKLGYWTSGLLLFLTAGGVVIMYFDPWWNHQFSLTLHGKFPSIGILLAVSNGLVLFVEVIFKLFKRNRKEGESRAEIQ